MYASFRSVTAKNGKILTPTRTGNFLLTSMDPEFYATLDKLSARLLKVASDVIAPILTGFINKSFTVGVFARVWKSAKVTALFKDGDTLLKDNYRPISILPTMSKIIERSANIQLSFFLEENRLLLLSQFGVRLCPVPVRRLLRPSRSMHFGDVSETNGRETPRQPRSAHASAFVKSSHVQLK